MMAVGSGAVYIWTYFILKQFLGIESIIFEEPLSISLLALGSGYYYTTVIDWRILLKMQIYWYGSAKLKETST